MAKGNLSACLDVTLSHEGGYTSDRRDPGNWTGGKVGKGVLKGTKYGIAANTYPNLDIKNLTKADVIPLYRARYWDGVHGDDLAYGVDLVVFDYGVNSGPARGAKALQSAVGVKADGKIVDDTVRKAAAGDAKAIIQGVCARRMSFLRALPTWGTFKRGWSRRVADVEAKALKMWLKNGAAGISAAGTSILKDEAAKAKATANKQQQGAGGATGGGVAYGGADAVLTGEPNWMLIAGVALAVVAVAGVLIMKASHNRERAKAYEVAAAS